MLKNISKTLKDNKLMNFSFRISNLSCFMRIDQVNAYQRVSSVDNCKSVWYSA